MNSTEPQSHSPIAYQPAWVFSGHDADGEHDTVRDGVVAGGGHASYLHTHPAAAPDAVVRFVAHAAGMCSRRCSSKVGRAGRRPPGGP